VSVTVLSVLITLEADVSVFVHYDDTIQLCLCSQDSESQTFMLVATCEKTCDQNRAKLLIEQQ